MHLCLRACVRAYVRLVKYLQAHSIARILTNLTRGCPFHLPSTSECKRSPSMFVYTRLCVQQAGYVSEWIVDVFVTCWLLFSSPLLMSSNTPWRAYIQLAIDACECDVSGQQIDVFRPVDATWGSFPPNSRCPTSFEDRVRSLHIAQQRAVGCHDKQGQNSGPSR